eukprot:SAG22_NODE_880_length_6703_cov_8.753786_6_plen_135_part_00
MPLAAAAAAAAAVAVIVAISIAPGDMHPGRRLIRVLCCAVLCCACFAVVFVDPHSTVRAFQAMSQPIVTAPDAAEDLAALGWRLGPAIKKKKSDKYGKAGAQVRARETAREEKSDREGRGRESKSDQKSESERL